MHGEHNSRKRQHYVYGKETTVVLVKNKTLFETFAIPCLSILQSFILT